MSDSIEFSPGDPLPDDLLLRYMAGQATPGERAQVDAHVMVHGSAALDTVRAVWAASADPRPAEDVTRFVSALRHRITAERLAPSGRFGGVARRAMLTSGVAALAAVAIFAMLRARHVTPDVVPPHGPQYATTTGQQATITLRDGSRVTLAPESRLTVSAGFGDADRRVTLDGEAYFDVQTHQGGPFVVSTRTGETRVLGTSFDVRQYAADRAMRVAVVSGKVSVGDTRVGRGGRAGTPLTIPAGQMATVDGVVLVATIQDSGAYTGWKDGQLVFKDAPVPEMLATVGRWYGYQFRLTDSALVTQHVNATIKLNGDTELLMKSLKNLLEVTMTFDDSVVTLHRKKNTLSSRTRQLQRDDFSHTSEIGK